MRFGEDRLIWCPTTFFTGPRTIGKSILAPSATLNISFSKATGHLSMTPFLVTTASKRTRSTAPQLSPMANVSNGTLFSPTETSNRNWTFQIARANYVANPLQGAGRINRRVLGRTGVWQFRKLDPLNEMGRNKIRNNIDAWANSVLKHAQQHPGTCLETLI